MLSKKDTSFRLSLGSSLGMTSIKKSNMSFLATATATSFFWRVLRLLSSVWIHARNVNSKMKTLHASAKMIGAYQVAMNTQSCHHHHIYIPLHWSSIIIRQSQRERERIYIPLDVHHRPFSWLFLSEREVVDNSWNRAHRSPVTGIVIARRCSRVPC